MSWIPDRDSKGNFKLGIEAFASKESDNKKLYKRVHGVIKQCIVGDNWFDLVVPYDFAKLNVLEIIGAEIGDTASFYVHDTPTGSISTVPDILLNQFGFDIAVAKDYYEQKSEYDADVIKDLKLRCKINSVSAKTMGVNFILNELK